MELAIKNVFLWLDVQFVTEDNGAIWWKHADALFLIADETEKKLYSMT